MPLPRALGRLNRVGLNRLVRPLAAWVPGLGLVEHVGRRTGRIYRTPVNVFPGGRQYTLALTYGPDTDWVRNVLADGACRLRTRGREVRLTRPRIVHDEQRAAVGAFARPLLRIVRVSDFLVLDVADGR